MTARGKAKNQPGYGNGVVSLRLDDLHLLTDTQIVDRLTEVFRSPHYTPPRLPASALHLLGLSRQAEVDLAEVAAVLEQDQLLAAEVLRVAQSAVFGGKTEPVRTLAEALVRLGLRRTTDVLLQATLQMRVFRVNGYQSVMDELRRHSVAVAHISRMVSRKTSLYDEHAFLCGLLHDVGIAASLIAVADSRTRNKKLPAFSLLWEAIRAAHSEAGEVLGRLWQLPEEVNFVLAHHHDVVVGRYAHPTSCVIELANGLAEEFGAGFGQESRPESLARAAKELRLSDLDMRDLRESTASLVAQLV